MTRFPKIATSRPLASLLTAGTVAAVMLVSTTASAFAADTPTNASPTPQQTAQPDRDAPIGTHIVAKPKDLAPIQVYGGAVHAAGEAQWTDDDTSVPELPMTSQ